MSEKEKGLVMPGAQSQAMQPGGAMVTQESQRAVAEVQGAILLAKRFPRNQQESLERILVACQRPTLAANAIYDYAKGGSSITGPTIRMAEAIAQNWGNLQFGIRELEQANGESTVEAFAWDMETNTRQVKVFQVPHKRYTRARTYDLTDPREIYELVANQGARRLRSCILGLIPGDVVDEAVKEVEKTMKANADTSEEAVGKLVQAFAPFGVTKKMIEDRIQRKVTSITPAQVVSLRKVYNSLRDGMSQPADWFPVEEGTPLADEVGLKDKPEKKPEPKQEKKPAEKKPAEKKPEPQDEPPPPGDEDAPANTKGDDAAEEKPAGLSKVHKELYETVANHCGGETSAINSYLTIATGRAIKADELDQLTAAEAKAALAKANEQIQIDMDFARGSGG